MQGKAYLEALGFETAKVLLIYRISEYLRHDRGAACGLSHLVDREDADAVFLDNSGMPHCRHWRCSNSISGTAISVPTLWRDLAQHPGALETESLLTSPFRE